MLTIKYLDPGVERMLFQWSFELVIPDVGLETGRSNISVSPSTLICTMCVSFFWGPIL